MHTHTPPHTLDDPKKNRHNVKHTHVHIVLNTGSVIHGWLCDKYHMCACACRPSIDCGQTLLDAVQTQTIDRIRPIALICADINTAISYSYPIFHAKFGFVCVSDVAGVTLLLLLMLLWL